MMSFHRTAALLHPQHQMFLIVLYEKDLYFSGFVFFFF